MRHNKFIIFLLAFFLFGKLSAQELTWTVPEKIKGRIIYSTILGSNGKNYFVLKFDKKSKQTFILEKYNSEMRLLKNYEFRIEKDISISKILYMDNKIYIFYSFYNKDKNQYKLYAKIMTNGFRTLNDDIHIASTSIKVPNQVLFRIKKDKATDRIYVTSPHEFTKETIAYKFLIFDRHLYRTFHYNLIFQNKKGFELKQIYLADTSALAIVSNVIKNKSRGKQSYYTLVEFDFKNTSKNEYKLYYDSVQITNGIFKHDVVNNTFTFTGLYKGQNQKVQSGIATLKIFKLNDSAVVHFIPFSKQLIGSINGKKSREKGLSNFYPRNVIVRSDGGIIFICEKYEVHQELYPSTYQFNQNYVRYFYQYKDIMVVSVNPDGAIDWTKIIRKDQVSMGDEEGYYSSFLVGAKSEKLVFLFNELKMNSSELIYYEIDPNGKVNHTVLVNSNKFDGYLIPKIGYQVSNSELLIPGFNRKRGFVLLKVAL